MLFSHQINSCWAKEVSYLFSLCVYLNNLFSYQVECARTSVHKQVYTWYLINWHKEELWVWKNTVILFFQPVLTTWGWLSDPAWVRLLSYCEYSECWVTVLVTLSLHESWYAMQKENVIRIFYALHRYLFKVFNNNKKFRQFLSFLTMTLYF